MRRKGLGIKKKEGVSYQKSGRRFGIRSADYRGRTRLKPKLLRYKSASTMDMDCLEHDIKMDPDVDQSARAECFGGSAVGILKALIRFGGGYKKNLKSSKSGSRKKICIVPKA
ncbi:hypothetical protein [Holospora curviuscula]|uniref:Transposase n=1 Tax=Holospora curviuscula TaxID=1082868 RepID=A0A2S5RDZ8_9PROT|nr:hypothetical protein [Holospora curviuscula]PPE05569.1 hypothetical protein HCUR_00215 [Holospora curviuscula]